MLSSNLVNLDRYSIKPNRIVQKTGKPDIPRFLYHITTAENYSEMLNKGFIRKSRDANHLSKLRGVFMFDMTNFAKRWVNTFILFMDYKINVGTALLLKNAIPSLKTEKNTNLVLLKIPTECMNINKLQIRPQNSFEEWTKLDSAIYQSIYTRRKDPIEYIYGDKIDMSNVEKIGETKVLYSSFKEYAGKISDKPFDILLKLLSGQPEQKGVEILARNNYKPENISLEDLPLF